MAHRVVALVDTGDQLMNTVHAASHPVDIRLAALRRFALAISVLTLVGHLILGFEMAYIHPCIALATAYTLELGLEWVDARLHGRPPGFMGGGVVRVIDFLLPGHITALACAMLLYTRCSSFLFLTICCAEW